MFFILNFSFLIFIMLWLIYTISAYFFTAIANTIDKVIVSKFIPKPSVYVFYVGILQLVALVLIPFGVYLPSLDLQALNFLAGAFFLISLYLLYKALSQGEATRVIPVVGGVTPLATLLFSYQLLGERLSMNQWYAFALLVLGFLVITHQKQLKGTWSITQPYVLLSFVSGITFALQATLSKYLFEVEGFNTAFFWMRIASAATALVLLIPAVTRRSIVDDLRQPQKTKGLIVIIHQTIGAVGFVLLNYAISMASVTIVNALQGVLYVFVFVLVTTSSRWISSLREPISRGIILQKCAAILLIGAGIYLLTI